MFFRPFFIASLLALSATCAAETSANQAPALASGAIAAVPAQLSSELIRQEYFASENSFGLQAPNRHLGIRTYFDSEGIRVVARTPEEETLFHWQLESLRRGNTILQPVPAEVHAHEAQVVLRQGPITQTFDNGEDGLRQSLRIDAAPIEGDHGALQLLFNPGPARASAAGGPNELRLAGASGAALFLSQMVASDSNGFALALTSSASADGRWVLHINDAEANYPITVKSVFTGLYDLRAQADQVSAHFATSVAVVGDINFDGIADIAVGASDWDGGQADEGAVFIYYGSALGGNVELVADKRIEIDQAGARFGVSVASAGDVNRDNAMDLIVGAPEFDNGQANEGAAFVYSGLDIFINTSILPYGQLEGGRNAARMGTSVAGAGDTNGDGFDDVVSGAPGFQLASILGGRAFVFLGGFGPSFDSSPDATWSATEEGSEFGARVAGAGDVDGDGLAEVLIGAPGAGVVEVHHGNGNTMLLDAVGYGASGAEFGASLASAGDLNGDGFGDIVIGAPAFTLGEGSEGAAFVFFGGNPFNAVLDARRESNQTGAEFASSLAGGADINGDGFADIVVGAPYFDQDQSNEGRVFVYYGKAGAFPAAASAEFQIDQVDAIFGSSVAVGDIDGDGYADILAGAPYADFGHSDEGAAYVYRGGGARVDGSFDTALGAVPGQSMDLFGFSVDGAGDINGDGFGDVIVGAPNYDGGEVDEGRAYLYLGSATGLSSTAFRTLQENQAGAYFGYSVSAAGDVNNDGFADVVVGARYFDQGEADEGTAFVYLGAANMDAVADARYESNVSGARLGWSVSAAGDVNGDGFADVIAGAPSFGASQTGAALLFFGGSGQLDVVADALLAGSQTDSLFGNAVSAAGDVNGDGFADVIVGAPDLDTLIDGDLALDVGRASLYLGGVGHFNNQADALLFGDAAGVAFASSVAGAGDINGDGFDDVVIGIPDATVQGAGGSGKAAVYFGARNGALSTHFDLDVFAQNQARIGTSVDTAGDVNRDGYADVIVGAKQYDNGGTDAGAAFLYYGSASGGSGTSFLTLNLAGGNFGTAVAAAGDINADGFADVVVGAPFAISPILQPGLARVFLGNSQAGRSVLAEQTADGSAPIQAWGSSSALSAFSVSLQAFSPRGRERVKIELQACPASVDFFNAVGCRSTISPTWSDTGANPNGILQVATLNGLPAHRLYHWRARSLFAPFTADLTSSPAATRSVGPWTTLQAQGDVADVRTKPLASDALFVDDFDP